MIKVSAERSIARRMALTKAAMMPRIGLDAVGAWARRGWQGMAGRPSRPPTQQPRSLSATMADMRPSQATPPVNGRPAMQLASTQQPQQHGMVQVVR